MKKLRKYYQKKIILIDRFIDSTIAYQHYGLGVDLKFVDYLNKQILQNFKVSFTFLNIVNEKNMLERLNKRKSLNRYDQFYMKFYRKVQKGFLKIMKKDKKKYLVIDSNLDIHENKKKIINKISRLIK